MAWGRRVGPAYRPTAMASQSVTGPPSPDVSGLLAVVRRRGGLCHAARSSAQRVWLDHSGALPMHNPWQPPGNPRSLRNFAAQAGGAEMLRLAACFATERGFSVSVLLSMTPFYSKPPSQISTRQWPQCNGPWRRPVPLSLTASHYAQRRKLFRCRLVPRSTRRGHVGHGPAVAPGQSVWRGCDGAVTGQGYSTGAVALTHQCCNPNSPVRYMLFLNYRQNTSFKMSKGYMEHTEILDGRPVSIRRVRLLPKPHASTRTSKTGVPFLKGPIPLAGGSEQPSYQGKPCMWASSCGT